MSEHQYASNMPELDELDVFGNPTNMDNFDGISKVVANKNIESGNSNMDNGNNNVLNFKLKRTVGHNKMFFSSFEIEGIDNLEDYAKYVRWADAQALDEYEKLKRDFPKDDFKKPFVQTQNDYGMVQNNKPSYQAPQQQYAPQPTGNPLPCKCGGQMMPSGKRTKDNQRAEYKCPNCQAFKWQ